MNYLNRITEILSEGSMGVKRLGRKFNSDIKKGSKIYKETKKYDKGIMSSLSKNHAKFRHKSKIGLQKKDSKKDK